MSSSCSKRHIFLQDLASQVKRDIYAKQKQARDAEDAIGRPQAEDILKFAVHSNVKPWQKWNSYLFIPLPSDKICNDRCRILLGEHGFKIAADGDLLFDEASLQQPPK